MLRALLVCACCALWLPAPSNAQTPGQDIRLSVDDTRDLIFVLLTQGNPAAASDAAQAVLNARPDDVPAWLGLSQAQLLLGNAPAAAFSGRSAWRAATSPNDRYAAAMVTARALAAQDQNLRAQFWLRRAFQVAPTDAARIRSATDLRRLRQSTPLRVQLDFGVQPSSNINGGARSERVSGGTISGSSLALSGTEFSTSAHLSYALPGNGSAQHALTGSLLARTYALSNDAKATAPGVTGSDFAYQELELGWRTLRPVGTRQLGHGLSFGRTWSGGENLSNFYGGYVTWSHPISNRDRLTWRYDLERQDRLDTDIRSSTLNAASLTWQSSRDTGVWSVSGRVADKASDSAIIDYDAASLSATFQPREAWIGTATRLSALLEYRDYPQPIIFGQREDQTIELSLDITFGGMDYYGFAPTLDLTARRTESTVDLYDVDTLSVGIGLTSLF